MDSPLILVVEDERPQQLIMSTALGARGYRVEIAANGAQASALAASLDPDVVLLDLGLPDVDGLHLYRRLSSMVRCPVIVVSADQLERRIVDALDLGVDDYIVKPFSMEVLLARLRVALRHRSAMAALVSDDLVICGDLRIDVAAHQAWLGEEPIELTARPFAMLVVLARNQGNVVSYSTLFKALDGQTPAADVDINPLRLLATKLRKALGEGPARPKLLNEQGVGYRLLAADM